MLLDFIKVFVVGGAICVIGQLLLDNTQLTSGRILVIFVVSGVVLTALGIYKPLVEFAQCGATVPLTGFGYALASGVQEAIQEQGALGILTGGIRATAGGITAAIVFGYFNAVVFHAKTKK